MLLEGKILATGFVPSPTEGVLYINGFNHPIIVTNLECVNTDVSDRVLNIRVKPKNEAAVNRSPYNMILKAGYLTVWNYEDQIVLRNGDSILGSAGAADVISFMIAGHEGI